MCHILRFLALWDSFLLQYVFLSFKFHCLMKSGFCYVYFHFGHSFPNRSFSFGDACAGLFFVLILILSSLFAVRLFYSFRTIAFPKITLRCKKHAINFVRFTALHNLHLFPSPGFHLNRCGTVLRVGHVQRPIAFHVTKPKTGKQQHICPYAYTCYTVQHSHRSIHAWHTLVDCLLFGVFWLRQSWFGALLWREWEFSNLCLWQKSVRSNNGKSNQITKYEIPKTTWK